MPVHEDIKLGRPTRDALIDNYIQTIKNLAAEGIDTICYNFMPVFDWTRTDLAYPYPDGSNALIFDEEVSKKMDPVNGELSLRVGIAVILKMKCVKLWMPMLKWMKKNFGNI